MARTRGGRIGREEKKKKKPKKPKITPVQNPGFGTIPRHEPGPLGPPSV